MSENVPSRYRNFATVVYPESAPEGWQSILSSFCVPCFLSPLHDKDINPTGEPKKPHYHVQFVFDGKKSESQVSEYVSKIGGVGCEVLGSLRGYARYLCHLDNPEKHQYPIEQVKAFGGADYLDTIGLPTDKFKAIEEMQDFVDANLTISFAQLFRYARAERRDWFRVLCESSALVMREYIKSVSWELEQSVKRGE